MKKVNIAILGATGAVGNEMLRQLEEFNIPIDELRLLASVRSVGQKIKFRGKDIEVQEATEKSFNGMDFVLGAVKSGMARKFAPSIVKSGAVFIDNSSAFRMDKDVPLVVPEINGEDARQNKGIIANPNCSTIITMMAVASISQISPIKTIIASTYQAVSGAGAEGFAELENQERAILENNEIETNVFPTQIAQNIIPFIGAYGDNLYTDEEMKMQNEGRRILHLPDMRCTCTCARVPVMRSHSISVTLRTERRVTVESAKEAISNFEGCMLVDDINGRDYPTPLDTSNQNLVYVGRVRDDLTDDNGLTLWCCGDQIRKGAATNAVQILKLLIMDKEN